MIRTKLLPLLSYSLVAFALATCGDGSSVKQSHGIDRSNIDAAALPVELPINSSAARTDRKAIGPAKAGEKSGGTPLFIVAGGLSSCILGSGQVGLDPTIQSYYNMAFWLKRDGIAAPRAIVACFGHNRGFLQYRLPGDLINRQAESIQEFLDATAGEISANPTQQVFLIGFSYGGWLIMHAANNLPAGARAISLDTIDPISAAECPISRFLTDAMDIIFFGDEDQPCTRDPADLRNQHDNIAAKTQLWRHFFQTRSQYLHSGHIAAASRGYHVEYPPNLINPLDAHFSMPSDSRIWNMIDKETREILTAR